MQDATFGVIVCGGLSISPETRIKMIGLSYVWNEPYIYKICCRDGVPAYVENMTTIPSTSVTGIIFLGGS